VGSSGLVWFGCGILRGEGGEVVVFYTSNGGFGG